MPCTHAAHWTATNCLPIINKQLKTLDMCELWPLRTQLVSDVTMPFISIPTPPPPQVLCIPFFCEKFARGWWGGFFASPPTFVQKIVCTFCYFFFRCWPPTADCGCHSGRSGGGSSLNLSGCQSSCHPGSSTTSFLECTDHQCRFAIFIINAGLLSSQKKEQHAHFLGTKSKSKAKKATKPRTWSLLGFLFPSSSPSMASQNHFGRLGSPTHWQQSSVSMIITGSTSQTTSSKTLPSVNHCSRILHPLHCQCLC